MVVPLTPLHDAPYPSSGPTPLQTHLAFFDKDDDGIIWPTDTYDGFRSLGYGILLCFMVTVAIHTTQAFRTQKSWIPDPLLRFHIAGVHRAKHGSDSHTYSKRGTIDEAAFEDIFRTYSEGPDYNTLTLKQTLTMWWGNRDANDFYGPGANLIEWYTTWILLAGQDGKMTKQDVRAMLEGSIFAKILAKKQAGELSMRKTL